MKFQLRVWISFFCIVLVSLQSFAQFTWTKQRGVIIAEDDGKIFTANLIKAEQETLLDLSKYPEIKLQSFSLDEEEKNIILFANAKKVWRYETKGDYFIYNIASKTIQQIGKGLKPSSLMFAKISPDGTKIAYVYEYNIYVEDLVSHQRKQLTKEGNRRNIYGGFDWVYEEEFGCRDGFRWSPDSKNIAFWYFDVSSSKDYLMVNTLDSIYPSVIPVEFPVAGDRPSKYKVGIVNIDKPSISWIEFKEDENLGSYLPNVEWASETELITLQMDRRQQHVSVDLINIQSKKKVNVLEEQSNTWVDPQPNKDFWNWIENKKSFLWLTEKDGWRHIWKISKDGKHKTLLTDVKYDVIAMDRVDEKNGYVYFYASPFTSYQKYLFRAKLNGGGVEQVTSYDHPGYHRYLISREDGIAFWMPMNHQGYGKAAYVLLDEEVKKASHGPKKPKPYIKSNIQYFDVEIETGVKMDVAMQLPQDFDSTKKYPVLFYVYTEPGAQTVVDMPGAMGDHLFTEDPSELGYILVTMDNRGTPAPKGAEWRKSIYGKIGQLNIDDQAKAAHKIISLPYIDENRVGVWGWSGGGSSTLHLMFKYPDIYKVGVAIAALTDARLYDNIYTERYMGLPNENKEGYDKAAVVNYASGLKGKLLYIHGTADDNVHINNADKLVDALIRAGKMFEMMYYPGRSHSIDEREGTSEHLKMMFTKFIKENL